MGNGSAGKGLARRSEVMSEERLEELWMRLVGRFDLEEVLQDLLCPSPFLTLRLAVHGVKTSNPYIGPERQLTDGTA
jgi:hypothetical protein